MLVWILCALLILAALVLAAAYAVFRVAFYSPRGRQNDDFYLSDSEQMAPHRERVREMIAAVRALPFERVTVSSHDGLTLAGRLYAGRPGAPVVIGFHGWRGTPVRDFSGGTTQYLAAGFHLLMIEERAHVTSGGHVITFGVKERLDCLTWIAFVRERFGDDVPILLAGISMGAATVLMATGLDLPPNVRGVIADAPYTSPRAIIRKVIADMRLPVPLAYPFAALAARLFGGFGLTDADAAEAVKRARIPILLIHGEDDRFVPCDMGREIAAANPAMIGLETFPNAGHGLSFLEDQARYERLTRAFFDRIFPE